MTDKTPKEKRKSGIGFMKIRFKTTKEKADNCNCACCIKYREKTKKLNNYIGWYKNHKQEDLWKKINEIFGDFGK